MKNMKDGKKKRRADESVSVSRSGCLRTENAPGKAVSFFRAVSPPCNLPLTNFDLSFSLGCSKDRSRSFLHHSSTHTQVISDQILQYNLCHFLFEESPHTS